MSAVTRATRLAFSIRHEKYGCQCCEIYRAPPRRVPTQVATRTAALWSADVQALAKQSDATLALSWKRTPASAAAVRLGDLRGDAEAATRLVGTIAALISDNAVHSRAGWTRVLHQAEVWNMRARRAVDRETRAPPSPTAAAHGKEDLAASTGRSPSAYVEPKPI